MPVELAPLAAPEGDDWLVRLAGSGPRRWLLRGDAEPLVEVLRAIVEGGGAPAPASWVGVVEGASSSVRYVAGGAIGTSHGRRLRAVVGPMDGSAAVALLDRVETAPVDVLLLQVDPRDAAAHLDAFRVAAPPVRFDRLILSRAGRAWGVIGLPGAAPPDVPGVLAGTAPQRIPPAPPATGRRAESSGRRRSLAAGVAAVAVLGLAAWLGLARTGSSPIPGPSPVSRLAAVLGPAPATVPALAYDAARQEAVLFGGIDPRSTTWLWSRRTWRTPPPAVAPADRSAPASAYDVAARRVLMFGGRGAIGNLNNDTWAWDGRSWTQLGSAHGDPPVAEFAGMAWDAANAAMVLVTPTTAVGGREDQTWLRTDEGWVQQSGSVAPPSEPSSALAFDPATRTVLLTLGGLSPGASPSTWSWDGTSWRQLHPAHEPDLGGFTSFLAPDPGATELLLTRLSVDFPQVLETWIWDGRDWTRARPATSPAGVVGLVAVPGTGVVAFGHDGRKPALIAWIWTGTTWTRA